MRHTYGSRQGHPQHTRGHYGGEAVGGSTASARTRDKSHRRNKVSQQLLKGYLSPRFSRQIINSRSLPKVRSKAWQFRDAGMRFALRHAHTEGHSWQPQHHLMRSLLLQCMFLQVWRQLVLFTSRLVDQHVPTFVKQKTPRAFQRAHGRPARWKEIPAAVVWTYRRSALRCLRHCHEAGVHSFVMLPGKIAGHKHADWSRTKGSSVVSSMNLDCGLSYQHGLPRHVETLFSVHIALGAHVTA